MLPRRFFVLLVALTSLVGSVLAGGAGAQEGSKRPAFEPLQGTLDGTGFTPASLDKNERLKVILEARGKSVGEKQGRELRRGGRLSNEERQQLRADLKDRQATIVNRVQQLDGRVLARYQDAFNGVAALVSRSALVELAELDQVVSVHPARTYEIDNAAGAQYIEANDAWADLGLTGEGTKVAILDTGVDYYHANFGGSGDPADFENDDTTVIEPGTFPTAKIVGGFDFVGDDYDASSDDPAATIPHPDLDPLDCNGHGSHVGGSAAGSGVLADGSTYTGPYDATTHGQEFEIGPGVAPEASILAYRVFGCSGSVSEEIIVAALERALEDGADVVNMSLGSPLGRTDEPSAEASNTLAEAGVVVVASAGNDGSSGYITGSPAVADRSISVAALDASREFLPAADFILSTGESLVAQNSNDAGFEDGTALEIKVLRNPDGTVSLGCEPGDYVDVEGKLVVTQRGTCGRVARAIHGEQAGAAAVVMINSDSAYPPFEGEITENPDTGEEFRVTIPFFGVRGVLGPSPTDDGDKLVAADGGSVTLNNTETPNPGYKRMASFTSGGPRNLDSAPKPDITAPGVSVVSTAAGKGTESTVISGTSMASPMTAGVTALVTEAHPAWSTEIIKAALMNTADATTNKILDYNVRLAGTGVVNARKAVDTVGLATTQGGTGSLAFGYEELTSAYSETLPLTLHNTGSSSLTYDLAGAFNGDPLGASLSLSPSTVTVAAGQTVTVDATLSLDAPDVAALPDAAVSNFGAITTIRGAVVASTSSEEAGAYDLRVPFLVAPRGLSEITPGEKSEYSKGNGGQLTATVPLSNEGIHSGTADVYAWGIDDPDDISGAEDTMDVASGGVQVLPGEALGGDPSDRTLVFAVNTFGKASNPSVNEFDFAIDSGGSPDPDFFVVGVDAGSVLAGSFDGRYASIIFNAAGEIVNAWAAAAPMNNSVALLPTLASDIGLKKNKSKFTYSIGAFSLIPEGFVDTTDSALYDSHRPSTSSGDFLELEPGQEATLEVSAQRGRARADGVLGWLVVTHDDAMGTAQADSIGIGELTPGR